jgi:hypothetical protein
MCISTCVDKTPPMTTRPRNASQQVLTKPLHAFEDKKMYHNSCLPNRSQAREDTKCISQCVKQTPLMPAETQKLSQRVLAKTLPCQPGHKINLNMY